MKAKELDDLKKSYKESMDELSTLRTKVCFTVKCVMMILTVVFPVNKHACRFVDKVSRR